MSKSGLIKNSLEAKLEGVMNTKLGMNEQVLNFNWLLKKI